MSQMIEDGIRYNGTNYVIDRNGKLESAWVDLLNSTNFILQGSPEAQARLKELAPTVDWSRHKIEDLQENTPQPKFTVRMVWTADGAKTDPADFQQAEPLWLIAILYNADGTVDYCHFALAYSHNPYPAY